MLYASTVAVAFGDCVLVHCHRFIGSSRSADEEDSVEGWTTQRLCCNYELNLFVFADNKSFYFDKILSTSRQNPCIFFCPPGIMNDTLLFSI